VDENRLQPLPAALRAREQGMLARLFYRTVVGANAHVDTVASYAELTPVHVLNPGLPSALDSVLARAWSGRYPVCADFLAAVRSALTRAVDATSNELDAQLRTSTPPLTQSRGTALPGILLIIALGVLFALIGIAIANASAWIIEPDGLAAFFRRGDTRAAGALNDRRADVAGRQNPLMGWSMVNGNAQRTNASDARLPAVRRALWRRDLRPDGPVLVGDGLLILRIQDRLLALDLLNGVNVWERALPNLLNLPDALALTQGPERMIIAADRESLQAIDLRTGQTRWRMTSASAPARVLVDEEAILAVTGDGTLYAYAPEDGQLLWIMRDSALPRRIAQPLVSDGAVLALLGDDGRIHVVDLRERRLRWSAVLESTAVASPVLGASSGLLFTPMPSGELRAYALHDGALIWQKQTCAAIRGLALANGRLLAACNDGVLAALGTTRGEIIWRTSTGTTALSAPVTDGALVSVASQIAIAGKAALRFFDIRSGADLPGRSMTLAPARTTLVNSGRVLIVQSSGIEALVD
jgi:outer membrane protein assembly factor BamB